MWQQTFPLLNSSLIFWFYLSSSIMMTAVIWIIQILHYPSFKFISESQFTSFESFHTKRITYIVAPLMLIESGTGLLLFLQFQNIFWGIQMGLITTVWLSTFALSVPIHGRLALTHDLKLIQRLIHTNWPRTISWTIKFILILFLMLTKIRISTDCFFYEP